MTLRHPRAVLLAVIVAVAGLLTSTASMAVAQTSPTTNTSATRQLSPAANEHMMAGDLPKWQQELLRFNGIGPAYTPVAYEIVISVRGKPQHFGAEYIFGRYIGFLLELRGTPAQVQYSSYVKRSQLVAHWNGQPVYRYYGQGWSYFEFDHHRGVNALLVLQGKSKLLTEAFLRQLDTPADHGAHL